MLPNLFFIISLLLSSFIFTTHSSHTQCLHHQKALLLQLKDELKFDSSYSTKLVQWNQTDDCCKWYGVECDAAGHIVSLQLDGEWIYGGIGDSSSLFKLVFLQKLNLANNDLGYTTIPRGIHNLTYLTHLNLSYAGFGGQLPAEVLSLRRLVSLDISTDLNISLKYPNLEMVVQNLTGLRELNLDGVNIPSSDERRKWSHIISSHLPNLTSLSFLGYYLSGPFAKSFSQLHSLSILRLDGNSLSTTVPDFLGNFSSLTILSLAGCNLKGSFPQRVFQIPTLQHIDLSENEELNGSIPPINQTGSLEFISLSMTNFSGTLPSSISYLKSLSYLDLSFCRFTGSIPSTFANLTQLTHVLLSNNNFTESLPSAMFEGLSNLVYLYLDSNSFSGNIPRSMFGLPSLSEVQLSNNQFIGPVEEFPIVNVSNIAILDLSHNRLDGPIPNSFFHLRSLSSLSLSNNFFSGNFQLDKIQSLTNLEVLDLSNNKLSVDVSDVNSSTYGPPQLYELGLASCNMSDFPHFIEHSDIGKLDLSNNRIAGEVPSWIWGKQLDYLNLSLNLLTDLQEPYHIPASLTYLDLHSNQLRGKLDVLIPPNISQLWNLLLSNNSFTGSIPTSLCTGLQVLDLSVNKLSGSIPSCLLHDITNLNVLDLRRNNISGRIPNNFSHECSLEYFDLSNNNLDGKIPKSLRRCKLLQFVNLGNNIINDTFPCMLSSQNLSVLILRSNRFHGEVRCHNSWPDLQILDISSNNFSGSLESINFSSWAAMVLGSDAQLRHINHVPSIVGYNEFDSILDVPSNYRVEVGLTMKGHDQELHKIWPEFNAIDFSCNNFGGEIPDIIGNLNSLHILNFSHNALNGSIPKSFGQLKELESIDLSRNQLSGAVPVELAGLTFLSILNVSYNKLVGMIPKGRQFQTFSADSFEGNLALCGFPLDISCSHTDDDSNISPGEDGNVEEKREIEWEYVSIALGYGVGLGSVVWLLLFCRSFREKYFDKIEEVVEDIFHARDMRRRRARRAARNRVRRQ